MTKPQIFTYTFGCKVNQFDTLRMETLLEESLPCGINQPGVSPDFIIVNTCSVTASADRQARQLIRKLHRDHPRSKIFVTGCGIQNSPQKFAQIEGVESIVSISDQEKLPSLLGFQNTGKIFSSLQIRKNSSRTRALLKIQEGCNSFCSYCLLPYVRGRSRSIPLEDICSLAKSYQKQGVQEIVVTGTDLASYGRELKPKISLSDALRVLLLSAPLVSFRISSLEPVGLTEEFFSFIRNSPSIRPHFHIPLQSGSDRILGQMNRKYSSKDFREKVMALSKTRDLISLGTDLLVGFPGETKEDFQTTLNFVISLPFSYLHVFPFSARPRTQAGKLKDDVSSLEKQERVQELRKVSSEKRQSFYSQFLGTKQKVLFEKKRDGKGCLCGYTPHYLPVRVLGDDSWMEREGEVRLVELQGEGEKLVLKGVFS